VLRLHAEQRRGGQEQAGVGLGARTMSRVVIGATSGRVLPVSRSKAAANSPRLIPIRRWIRHTDEILPRPGRCALLPAGNRGRTFPPPHARTLELSGPRPRRARGGHQGACHGAQES
jgi:hypothetical protein